jgi:TatD DNase family protein
MASKKTPADSSPPVIPHVGCELFDTHAHLDDEQFQNDLPELLARASAAGVRQIVTIATTAPSTIACVALADKHPELLATAGIQPNHVAGEAANAWDVVLRLADRPRVVALGETGLDRHWNDTPFAQQEDFFARHLALARQQGLPVVIHCREAEADVVRGVMHSFTGDAATANACLAMGLHISFAGMLTYKNAQALRDVARTVPLDRVLIETDSPYLAPVPLRGRRNEPAFVVHTLLQLAAVMGREPAEVGRHCTENARALFQRRPV